MKITKPRLRKIIKEEFVKEAWSASPKDNPDNADVLKNISHDMDTLHALIDQYQDDEDNIATIQTHFEDFMHNLKTQISSGEH